MWPKRSVLAIWMGISVLVSINIVAFAQLDSLISGVVAGGQVGDKAGDSLLSSFQPFTNSAAKTFDEVAKGAADAVGLGGVYDFTKGFSEEMARVAKGALTGPSFDVELLNKNCGYSFSSDKRCPPLEDNQPNKVNITFVVDSFGTMDELAETLTVSGTIVFTWEINICTMVLPPYPFGNDTERIIVPENDYKNIWRPRILMTNNVDDPQLNSKTISDNFELVFGVKSFKKHLKFIWSRTGTFTTSCRPLRLGSFPFDTQSCPIRFQMKEITMFTIFDKVQLYVPDMSVNNELELTSFSTNSNIVNSELMTKVLSMDQYSVSEVEFWFVFRRIAFYYANSLITPCAVLGILELAIFLMYNESGERSTFSVTILLAFTFLQSDFLKALPKTPQAVLLGTYIRQLSLFTGACTLQSMIMFWLTVTVLPSCKEVKVFGKPISILRIVDLGCSLIALVVFIFIHLTLFSVI